MLHSDRFIAGHLTIYKVNPGSIQKFVLRNDSFTQKTEEPYCPLVECLIINFTIEYI